MSRTPFSNIPQWAQRSQRKWNIICTMVMYGETFEFRTDWPLKFIRRYSNIVTIWRLWQASWISDRNNFRYVLHVPPMVLTNVSVKWSFGSEEEVQNRFSKWRLSWISDRNKFSFFLIYRSLDTAYQIRINLPFRLREKIQNIFSS